MEKTEFGRNVSHIHGNLFPKMKKLIFLILTLLCFAVFSNDWEFGSEGEHLIPLEISDVSIKSEKIVLEWN